MPGLTNKQLLLAIVIPTYNEAANLPKLLSTIKTVLAKSLPKTYCTVLIVDDNSPDKTGVVADRLAIKYSSDTFSVNVLHRDKKEGLGKAYVAGFKHILKGNYTHVLQMDADMSHSPSYIPQLIDTANNADMVVGSRYIQGGGTPDWSAWRKLQSQLGNHYARMILGNSIHDYTGGFNLYSIALLKKLDLDAVQSSGYGFQIELKHRAMQTGAAVSEVPIIFVDRLKGKSKIPRSTIISTLLLVPKLRLSS